MICIFKLISLSFSKIEFKENKFYVHCRLFRILSRKFVAIIELSNNLILKERKFANFSLQKASNLCLFNIYKKIAYTYDVFW